MPSLDSPLPNPNSEMCPEPFGRAQDRFAKRSKVFCSYPSPLLSYVFRFAFISVAVGTGLASGPPHRSVREGLPHTALTSGSSDSPPLVGIQMHPFLPLAVRATTSVTRFPGSVSGTSALVVRSPWSTSFPLRTPLPTLPRQLCSPASLVLRGRPTPCKRACRHYGL